MAFENKSFKVLKKTRLPNGEISLTCKIAADGEVKKVFALSFNALASTQEITPGQVSYNGKLDICMIYQLDNDEIDSASSSCPFTSKFEDKAISTGEKAIISLKEVDHEIEAISGSEVTINVTLEQSGVLIETVDVNSIGCNDENICAKEEELSIVRYIGSGSAQAQEVAERGTREKVKKVLGSQTSVIVKEAEPSTNFVAVSGDVVTNVLYIDENDKFSTIQVYDAFKEEIEIEGVSRDSFVEATSFVNADNVKVSVDNDDKGGKISVSTTFEITAYAFEESGLNMVVDLYSTQNEIEVSTESFNMSRPKVMECIEGKIDGSLTIDQEQPRIDKILFTFGSSAQITNTYVSGDELILEGIAKTCVVYLNDDEGSQNSVEIEVPFQISEKTKASENATLLSSAILTDVDVVAKKGRELFFDGKVRAIVQICEDEVSAVISDAKEGEALNERDYAMQLVFAGQGATLWDVAKMNRVKENVIAEQNPNVIFPLQENQQIIIFYQNK